MRTKSPVDARLVARCGPLALVLMGTAASSLAAQVDSFPADSGPVQITPSAGAGVQLEYLGVVLHVDPWSRGDYSRAKPADVILITDTPADHLDPELIRRLSTPSTVVIVPAASEDARDEGGAERLRAVGGAVMRNDERIELAFPRPDASGVTVE